MNSLWSAAREKRAEQMMQWGAAFIIAAGAVAALLLIVHAPAGLTLLFGMIALGAFFVGIAGSVWQQRMAPNRPYHGAAGLTVWRKWPDDTSVFAGAIDPEDPPYTCSCACGRGVYFHSDDWRPNVVGISGRTVDQHGGRYSKVCACGRGHYKLGKPPASNPIEEGANYGVKY